MGKIKIYLDNCCYNRPFDDLTQTKIYLESKAIESIISKFEKDDFDIYTSKTVDYEISKITDITKKFQVENIYNIISPKNIEYTEEIRNRAFELRQYNIKSMDSLHIAFAESINTDYFITTDTFLIKISQKIKLKTTIINPIEFITEVVKDD